VKNDAQNYYINLISSMNTSVWICNSLIDFPMFIMYVLTLHTYL